MLLAVLLLDSVNLDFLIWILDSFSCCICCFPEPHFSRNLSCQKFFCLFVFLPEEKVFIFFIYLTYWHSSRIRVLQLEMAEECLKRAMDLSGLLLLYSSLGDAEGISELALLAKNQGKNNVAFLCLFMLGKLEECLALLLER